MGTLMMRCTAYDTTPITRRSRTPEGYLLVPAMVAASDNVQPYLASELGIKDALPTKLIRVFRPKAVVDAAAPLFDGVPITLDHPPKMVDTKIYRAVNRGRAMNVVAKDAGLEADLLVQDDDAIKAVETGTRKEVSAAYDFDLEMQAGTSPHGQAYDAVASNIVPNHIALVRVGRSRTPSGRPCAVADSATKGDHMRVLVFDALLLGAATSVQLPEMDDGAATQVDGLIRNLASARDAATTERDQIMTECAEKLELQTADHAAQLKTVTDAQPALIAAAAKDMADVMALGLKHGLVLKATDTAGMRLEIIAELAKKPELKKVFDAMLPDFTKAEDGQVKLALTAVDAMGGLAPVKAKAHDALGKALAGKDPKVEAQAADADGDGRQQSIIQSANAWKRPTLSR
jgi:hypothetical protein